MLNANLSPAVRFVYAVCCIVWLGPWADAASATNNSLSETERGIALSPQFVASRTNGVAPLVVFFDAYGEPYPDPNDPDAIPNADPLTPCTQGVDGDPCQAFHDLHYDWDFGDPGAGNWSITGGSKNHATGALTAHVFDQPGSYQVTVAARNSFGESGTAVAQTITVLDPEAAYSDTTLCVSRDTDFTGCPVGAAFQVTDVRDLKVIVDDYVNDGAGDTRRLLFHDGQTWTKAGFGDGLRTLVEGPVHLGSFGSGRAVLVSLDGGLFSVGHDDWRFVDLHVDGIGETGSKAFSIRADRLLVYRVSSAPDAWHRTLTSGGGISEEIAIVETDFEHPSWSVYGLYRRLAFLGNRSFGHMMRIKHWDGIVLSHNRMGRHLSGQLIFTLRNLATTTAQAAAHSDKCPQPYDPNVCTRWNQKSVITDNFFESGQSPGGMNATKDGTGGDWGSRGRDLLFERNFFFNYYPGYTQTAVDIFRTQGVTLRNNIFVMTQASSGGGRSFQIRQDTSVESPPTERVRVYNNTFYTGDGGYDDAVEGIYVRSRAEDPLTEPVWVVNNLMHMAMDTPAVLVRTWNQPGIVSGDQATNVLFPFNDSPFEDPAPSLNPTDYRLNSDSGAVNGGVEMPGLVVDFNLRDRDSQPDVGAFEFGTPVFTDGFESGTTGSWSSTQP